MTFHFSLSLPVFFLSPLFFDDTKEKKQFSFLLHKNLNGLIILRELSNLFGAKKNESKPRVRMVTFHDLFFYFSASFFFSLACAVSVWLDDKTFSRAFRIGIRGTVFRYRSFWLRKFFFITDLSATAIILMHETPQQQQPGGQGS